MAKKYWSKKVTEHSDVLNLEEDVFTWKDPAKIAKSLRRTAEKDKGKKGNSFQSVMSMLNFYINRAGKNLKASQKKTLDDAKTELRKLYDKKKK
ncbi:hypothetical protein COT77_02015 [Candidatus Berkelbacteria bacterium CG10_big_fil_rev_8_21_14_0_10_41_12]|uniref:DUF3175 domain-containing protein n=1 Tax=Candidatus Berkelbacteria bacterium CG10_big_fil_rev_8_21_14_0_10_41_12 TaxID=1974513 RepID=A0A2M6WX02_9BACT|nr:MAG: hypothetical protein COT77_02015 [Candidatus Berkelbacteria bacterium CG10_big_fil_rev_8_21_14_0_10_41_12]